MLSVGLQGNALLAFTQISQPAPWQKMPPNTKVEVGSNKNREQQKIINKRQIMADLNITVLSGRLVRDPITRNNGSRMSFFTIAANRRYRDKSDNLQEETAFVACKCFGGWAEAVARHGKGDMLIAEGRLRTESWEAEGTTRSQLVLLCDSVQFVTPEPRAQGMAPSSNGTEKNPVMLPNGGPAPDAPPF